jgi:hypothetical protein
VFVIIGAYRYFSGTPWQSILLKERQPTCKPLTHFIAYECGDRKTFEMMTLAQPMGILPFWIYHH